MPRFQWDPEKAKANRAKHGIAFELATRVWDDHLHQIAYDDAEAEEERWLAIGAVGPVVILVVVHTCPDADDEHVRIISARKATLHERRRYERETFQSGRP